MIEWRCAVPATNPQTSYLGGGKPPEPWVYSVHSPPPPLPPVLCVYKRHKVPPSLCLFVCPDPCPKEPLGRLRDALVPGGYGMREGTRSVPRSCIQDPKVH